MSANPQVIFAMPDPTLTFLFSRLYSDDTSEEYLLTPVLAAGLLSAGLTQDVQNCPKTVFALVGYSKGAMVVHETGLPADIKSKVVAVVVFGDPFTEETGMAFERTEGMTEGIGEGTSSNSHYRSDHPCCR